MRDTYGYWPDNQPELSLEQARQALADLLLKRFPAPPARILELGRGHSALGAQLARLGYEVTARPPAREWSAAGSFPEAQAALETAAYDVILVQDALHDMADPEALFSQAKCLLKADGRLVLGDEVSARASTREHAILHSAAAIETAFAAHGFYAAYHQRIGAQIAPSCAEIVRRLEAGREHLAAADEAWREYWQYRDDSYRGGQIGYEIWDLRPSDFSVRAYREGDEIPILQSFCEVFQVRRALSHWRWKFRESPFGGPYLSTVWKENAPVAHYGGYPLPLWTGSGMHLIYHVGDTHTQPAYRGLGKGKTSLLGRAFRHFERCYCEHTISFGYGFNTGKIQRFGTLFLGYTADTPVYEWSLKPEPRARHAKARLRLVRLRGYTVSRDKQVHGWADQVFEQACRDYPWLVARGQSYLRWRYQDHPDFNYEFYVIRRWGRPVGWWLVRREGRALWLGDALFCRAHAQTAAAAGLSMMLREGGEIHEVKGWFAETPAWWIAVLTQLGFEQKRQHQNLDFCVKTYAPGLSAAEVAEQFYFTWGDSDLF